MSNTSPPGTPLCQAIDGEGRSFDIHGCVAARFEPVLDAFRDNFASGEEMGAAVCIWRDGKRVVDLWGGYKNAAGTQPWVGDTLVNGMSSTKPLAATCFHVLVDRGLADYDDPIDRYWPEFGQNGKQGVPIRYILDHRLGLPLIPAAFWPDKLFDWDGFCTALAAEVPLWEPGTDAGYHVRTYGFLIGEVVRRIDGRTLGRFFDEEIAQPFELDYHIGLPVSELDRCADFIPETRGTIYDAAIDQTSYLARASPAIDPQVFNSAQWRTAELPASNGHGSARALSRFYAILANGGVLEGKRLLRAHTLARATEVQHSIHERVMDRTYQQALGFLRSSPPIVPMGPLTTSFGHQGAGGALGFADPVNHVGFGYLMNKMHARRENGPRAGRLIDALYRCLENEEGAR